MEQTPNYKLLKPAPNDYVDIGTFNQNTDLIDSELKKKYGPDNKPTAADVGAAPAEADASYPSCYYRMVNGVKEWINPPMQLGVEYRTTERHGGKPVYAKRISHTSSEAISGDMRVYIPHGITYLSTLVRIFGRSSAYPVPYFSLSGVYTGVEQVIGSDIKLVSHGTSWQAGTTFVFDIYFTKTTD